MKTQWIYGLAVAAAVMLPATAMAQDGPAAGHGKASFMSQYDADGDGAVTQAEFLAGREAKYNGFDLDGDGAVSEAEYVEEYIGRLDRELAERRARQIRQTYVRYGVLDSDKDRNMTLDEFNASGSRMFERLDSNGDGVIDSGDTAAAY
ncbi:EF-hand domain-containing protein [Stakelama tenebrarum]|nr:hypothetical protein [Sphingosinithalassobacter tenebrarum]